MNKVTVKATSIASVELGDKMFKLVCFQYDKDSLEALHQQVNQVVKITLEDESGEWVGNIPYRILSVDFPSRFVKRDMAYVELAPFIEGTHFYDQSSTREVAKDGAFKASIHKIDHFIALTNHGTKPPTPESGHGEFVNESWKMQTIGANVFKDFPPEWATHVLWYRK